MAQIDVTTRLARPAEGFYTSQVTAPSPWPLRTFLPSGYEPNYPYPLLVFLHGNGGSEEQILRLAPRLSRRNYICIGLRGPIQGTPRADGRATFSWGSDCSSDALVEEYVIRAVEQTRRNFHVHSERIYLAGFGEGATLAYNLGLQFPERFAGIISMNGCMARRGRPLLRLPDIRRLKVLIGHGVANAIVPQKLARDDHHLLYIAGLSVKMHSYASNHRIHPDMLRDMDRWIMAQISSE
jgi:phospholipase/carboxylesterase